MTIRGSRTQAIKIWLLALAVFFQASSWVFAAATLMGVVRENQVGGSPAKNVLISALGANRTSTGDDGQFVLRFPQLQPGEDVSIDVLRNGWVVVNDIQLKRALPANAAQSPLEILISKAEERKAWALKFYRLQGERVLDTQYELKLAALEPRYAAEEKERARLRDELREAGRDIKVGLSPAEFEEWRRKLKDEASAELRSELAKEKQADQEKIAELERRITKAEADLQSPQKARAEYNATLVQATKSLQQIAPEVPLEEERARLRLERFQARVQTYDLSRQLAARPASAMSEDYRKAAALFLEGKMDEALEILSEEHLKQRAADMKKQQEDTVRGWLLRGQMLAVKLDFDGAARAYKEAVGFAPNSYDAWFAYSSFHHNQNHFRKARAGYEKALVLARASGRDEDVARTLYNLGMLHHDEKRMAEARQAFEESLKLYRKLARQKPDVYLPDVALILYDLGNLNLAENRMDDAREAYEKSLKIRRKLAQQNPDLYLDDVARILYDLGNLNLTENHMAEARAVYEEALKLYRKRAQQNPDLYLPYVAGTLNNMGELNRAENRMAQARQAFEESLKISRKLAQKNPDVFLSYVALILNNLGNLHRDEKRTADARAAYEESLKLYRKLIRLKPDVYLPDVALILYDLGNLNRDEKRMKDARAAYEESLKIRRKLADKNPDVFLPDVAETLNNMGELNHAENRMDDAREAYEKSLKIYRAFAKIAPAAYEPFVRKVQGNLDELPRTLEMQR